MEIQGQLAIVTGAASGMGLATARALAQRGARVAVVDQDTQACGAVAQEIGGIAMPLDVTDRESAKVAFETLGRRYGTAGILVTCAGVTGMQPFVSKDADAAYASMLRTISINLGGTLNFTNLFAQDSGGRAASQDERVVIMVASGAAFDGVAGAAAYCAAKGGIVSLTHALARELCAQKIRVNTISPGPMDTPMLAGLPHDLLTQLTDSIPFPRRAGHAEEFAALAIHLCENRFLNGSVIRLDGAHRTSF